LAEIRPSSRRASGLMRTLVCSFAINHTIPHIGV
jgi:hypothetical protein